MTNVIDEAYKLYMPQDRYEIEELYRFVTDHYNNREADPYNIVEIGTKYGGTFLLWCSLNTSSGMNVSIDMNDGGRHGGILEGKMDERDAMFIDRFKNVHFIRGNSHDAETLCKLQTLIDPSFGYKMIDSMYSKMELVDALQQIDFNFGTSPYDGLKELIDSQRQIDFLFIDGDHTYEGVKMDFRMYSPFVKDGGIIAFHDTNDSPKHRDRGVYVSKLWKEILDSGEYETIEFNSNLDWAGIGVIIK